MLGFAIAALYTLLTLSQATNKHCYTTSRDSLSRTHYRYHNPPALLATVVNATENLSNLATHHHQPLCPTSLLGQGALNGSWYHHHTVDGGETHLVYEPDTCITRRLHATSARDCLRGRHIVLLGDSIMRYTYLDLAQYLVSLKHAPQYHMVEGGGNTADERSFGNWHTFFTATQQVC